MNEELRIFLKVSSKLLILAVTLLLFDWLAYPRIISHLYSKIDFNQYCFEPKTDVLVLGDSHTQRSVNPNFSDNLNVHNFSKTGSYLPINYAIYSAYREKMPPPTFVVLSMEHWTFKDKPFLGNYFFIKNKSYGSQYIKKSMIDFQSYGVTPDLLDTVKGSRLSCTRSDFAFQEQSAGQHDYNLQTIPVEV